MKVIFENLNEIKEFILMNGYLLFMEKQEEWGGLGVIITDHYVEPESKETVFVTKPEESKAFARSDKIIITPYAKQLSWLIDTLYRYSLEHKELSPDILLDGFYVTSLGFFLNSPHHYPQELMLFIVNAMIRMTAMNPLENKRNNKEQNS